MDTSSCSFVEPCSQDQSTCINTPRRCAPVSTPSSTHSRTKSCTPKTPCKTPTSGDRFIPSREEDLDIAHFYVTQNAASSICSNSGNYVSVLADSIFEGRAQSKILSFKTKAPVPPIHVQNLHTIYPALAKGTTPKKQYHRHIPNTFERVLDAPEIANNFYLNILDWGINNIVAVGLGNDVYCWNENTCKVSQLPSTEDNGLVTSVSWQGMNYLAIGTENGDVQLWDVEHQKRVRTMHGHSARVGVLAWNEYILSSGSRDTSILNHDVRVSSHHIATLAHQNEVCGLKWNLRESTQLASGGNDNVAHIWDIRNTRTHQPGTPVTVHVPLYSLPHMGAVKALAWCPFQSNLLATGGGSSDRSIRFWSSSTGALINTINTSSQVCQLLWSTHYRELLSAHGYSSNSLAVWKYPSMSKVATLDGHTDRVLYLALSPDGETCVSGAGDETLRFWKVFEREGKGYSTLKSKQMSTINNKHTMIR